MSYMFQSQTPNNTHILKKLIFIAYVADTAQYNPCVSY
jgi:hypothetical protein